ncbi:Protein of unknown function [Andreprevotia lacus DSM 23236]|jgi:hypothetical protein|uniref:DUF2818 domain-containing protein n=1 Tax=Andreprevotia lacus DSM 23236 TaxID=1121001 RepID=A0A1W1X013_9NEIS|nr:DUF2818 family protein [Andreprevotia lacus]SMC17217.1 Protein of unknown function [Andreprevotia lacus DSM 23236]
MFETILICTLAAVAANVPFVTGRLFGLLSLARKHFGWQLLEWLVYYLLLLGVARLLEGRVSDVHPQNWQFYATTLALFVVLAWPGFVWRYFWRKPGI